MPTQDGQRSAGRTKEDLTGMLPAGRSCFLGIAIDDYTGMGKLNNAVRDMEAVRDLLIADYDLEAANCRVLCNADATRKNILRTLRDLPKWVDKHDKLIIYYSGHGHLDEHKDGFWVPVEGKRGEEEDFVSNVELRNSIAKLPFRHILLISDACFSGALFVRGTDRADAAADDLEVRTSRWALCSGRHDQLVADGTPGEHSPFAASILAELRHNTHEALRIRTLATRVTDLTRANYDQLPEGDPLFGVGHEGGEYIFRRRVDDSVIWDHAQLADTPDAYRAYLAAFPHGAHANEATLAIREKEHVAELTAEIEEAVEEMEADKITKAKRLLEGIRRDIDKHLTRESHKAPLLQAVQRHLAFCEHYADYRPIFEKILGSDQRAALATAQATIAQLEADQTTLKATIATLQRDLADKTAQADKATEDLTKAQATIAQLETQLADTQTQLRELKAKHEAPQPAPPKPNDKMVFIKGGTYDMGDVMGYKESDDETVHHVTLSDFYIGRHAVTFAEYDAFCEATKREKPSDQGWGRENRPVINVSWYDVVEYCNWLSEQQGLTKVYEINGKAIAPNWTANGYRLPTEAEWEYAARDGGKKVRFGNGKDVIDPNDINFDASESYKKPYSVVGEYRQQTVPVGSLNSPNALGLHDMSGNVREWCWDWYGDYLTAEQTNPRGADMGTNRVHRGGSWLGNPRHCRAANRYHWDPSFRNNVIGFRLARS